MDPGVDPFAPILDTLDCTRDSAVLGLLFQALETGPVAACLCDEHDRIRFANPAFRRAFFPQIDGRPVEFVDAIATAIVQGTGMRLESMPLDAFVPRVKARRRTGKARFEFSLDLADGSWWRINDFRLDDGWTFTIASDISGLKAEETRLRAAHATAVEQAQTDFLTGLANRRHGMDRAEAAVAEFEANRLPLTMCLVDIDHFKQINNVHGHEVGDAVLVHFAHALRAWEPQVQVSRIGGEEFLVVMPGTPRSRALNRMAALMQSLAPLPLDPGRPPLRFSFSAGIASAIPSEGLKAMLSRADAALYLAKSNGRGRIETDSDVRSAAA